MCPQCLRGKRDRPGGERTGIIFKEAKAESFPNVMETTNLQIQELKNTQTRTHKTHTRRNSHHDSSKPNYSKPVLKRKSGKRKSHVLYKRAKIRMVGDFSLEMMPKSLTELHLQGTERKTPSTENSLPNKNSIQKQRPNRPFQT